MFVYVSDVRPTEIGMGRYFYQQRVDPQCSYCKSDLYSSIYAWK